MDRPYTNLETTKEYVIREFDENIDPIELMWYRDNEDRLVEVLEGSNKEEVSICIKKHQCHRVIKGNDTLKLKIYKL